NILRHGWIYFVGSVMNRAAGLLLLPLYAKVLTPEEFGVYALIVVFGDLLSVVLTSGISNALVVEYFASDDQARRRRVVATSTVAMAVMVAVLLAAAYPAGHVVGGLLFGGTVHDTIVSWAIAGIAFGALFEFVLSYYRMLKRSNVFVLASVFKSVLLVGTSTILLLVLDYGVAGIFIAITLSFALLSTVLLAVIVGQNGVRCSGPLLGKLLKSGLPFVPAALLDVASAFSERYFLGLFQSTGAVGVYAFGTRLSHLIYMFIINPFSQIWWVHQIETAQRTTVPGAGAIAGAGAAFQFYTVLLCGAALGVTLLTPELLLLLATPAYGAAVLCTPFLALGMIFWGVRMHSDASLVGAGHITVLPLLSAASLAVGILLSAVLSWRYGLIGAAAAHLGRQFFYTAVTELVCRRFCQPRLWLPVLRVTGVVALAAGFHALAWALFGTEIGGLATVAAKVGLVAVFVPVAALGPAMGPEGRAMLAKGLRRRLSPKADPQAVPAPDAPAARR
ncbi:MAG TPA: oligosaccharide flippase family protein, partial [Arenibaculum sp.]|nr:oligosaccharide flippase family protein [Arenibaculum sp.]